MQSIYTVYTFIYYCMQMYWFMSMNILPQDNQDNDKLLQSKHSQGDEFSGMCDGSSRLSKEKFMSCLVL